MKINYSPVFPINPGTKKPKVKWQGDKENRPVGEFYENEEALGFAPPEGYVIVDADTPGAVVNIEKLIKARGLDVFSYNTTRGKHYVFRLEITEYSINAKIGNTNGGTPYLSKSEKLDKNGEALWASDIDVKGNLKGYVKIKDKNVYRVEPAKLIEEFEKAPFLPMSLMIPSKMKIDINDYLAGARDSVAFEKWLPKLRAKGMTRPQWVDFMVDIKYMAGDEETVEDTMDWAAEKWDSSVSQGPVKDFVKIYEDGDDRPWTKGFDWARKEDKATKETTPWQARGINDYEIIAEQIVEKLKLQYSPEDKQIWGLQFGIFKPLPDVKKIVARWLVKHIGNIGPNTINNIVNYIEHGVPMKRFNKNPLLVSFNNKIINAKTQQEVKLANDEMLQNTIPWNYVPFNEWTDKHKDSYNFLTKIMRGWTKGSKGLDAMLYQMFGQAMTKYVKKPRVYFLTGIGNNGKSVALDWLISILGEHNVSSVDVRELSDDRFAAANLYGKLANVSVDSANGIIKDTSKVKRISSGDRIESSFKNKDSFGFKPYATPINAVNEPPIFAEAGDSDGMSRRLVLIPFNNEFADDPEWDDKEIRLHSKEVVEVAIAMSIDAISKVINNGGTFSTAKVSRAYMDNYLRSTNYMFNFVEESGIFNNEVVVSAHQRYKKWCKSYDYQAYGIDNFKAKYINMARKYGKKIHIETVTGNGPERHIFMIENQHIPHEED